MPNPKPRIESVKRAPAVLFACLAVTALGAGIVGCEGSEDSEGLCVSTEQFFAEKVWAQTIQGSCFSCHNKTGVGAKSQFVMSASSEAGYLETNLAAIKTVAETERNGKSVLLLKPTAEVAHEGGEILKPGTPQYEDLAELVQMLKEGNACKTNKASFFAGVNLANQKVTLRKATIALAARVPTDAEIEAVEKKGFDALGPILDQLMTEEPFYDRIRESYNNQFLTDQYLDGGLDLLGFNGDEEQSPENNPNFYNPGWFIGLNGNAEIAQKYGAGNADNVEGRLYELTEYGVAREPLELIAYVVRNNKPFTEVLTADYFVVNPMAAKAYNVVATFNNEYDADEWQPARIEGLPHAGVLTSRMWLERHPTTPTNRNRHRARMVFYDWLGTDILKTAERPLDPTKITDHNPTMNNPACTVCHAGGLDNVAGLFSVYQASDQAALELQGFDVNNMREFGQADYFPDFQWYNDMRPPGFGTEDLPIEERARSLPWLAQRITRDGRFPLAVVYQAFRAFIGQEPTLPPTDTTDPEFKVKFEAYLGQYYALSEIAENFVKSNYNFKQIIKDLVMSPYFRAENASANVAEGQREKFGEIGTAHLLTPEELDRKVRNVLGEGWDDRNNDNRLTPFLVDTDDRYRLLYGGMNSRDVTSRIKDPNGIMANVVERMGNEMSCRIVGEDFALPQADRKWFTDVEAAFAPKDASGFEVSGAVTGIKENIRKLHYKILGEDLEVNDPEIERTYQLFLSVWEPGFKAVNAPQQVDEHNEPIGEGTWFDCAPERNPATGAFYTQEERAVVADDALYTKRAWMAVFTYLITDYKFIYE